MNKSDELLQKLWCKCRDWPTRVNDIQPWIAKLQSINAAYKRELRKEERNAKRAGNRKGHTPGSA